MSNNTVYLENVAVTFDTLYECLDPGQKQHMANRLYKYEGIQPQQLKGDSALATHVREYLEYYRSVCPDTSLWPEVLKEIGRLL